MTEAIFTNKEELFDTMSEEQLMKHIETLDNDDFFTIDYFIIPRLKLSHNISYATMVSRRRYHTYGDVI